MARGGIPKFQKGRRRGRRVARVATLAEFLNFQNEGGIPKFSERAKQVRSSLGEPQFERENNLLDFGPNFDNRCAG